MKQPPNGTNELGCEKIDILVLYGSEKKLKQWTVEK